MHTHMFKIFCIEIQITYYKSHHFKVYNSVIFSIFTELCNYHHCLILEYFHPPKQETLYPLAVTPHSQPSQQPLVITTNLLSVSMNLPILELSYKWKQYMVFYEWLLSLNFTNGIGTGEMLYLVCLNLGHCGEVLGLGGGTLGGGPGLRGRGVALGGRSQAPFRNIIFSLR